MSDEEKSITEEITEKMEEVHESLDVENEGVNNTKDEIDSLKIFEDRKFYKPTQIATTLCISPMTVVRSLDRNKIPYLSDASQKKKIRLYRGKDLNSVYTFSKND